MELSSRTPDKWDRRFIELARHIAGWSKDPSTKVGCVIVNSDRTIASIGYNGLPRGVIDTPERLGLRDAKLAMTLHAEGHPERQSAARRMHSLYMAHAAL